MSEQEMKLGRTLGSSALFIYQALKFAPESTLSELELETRINMKTVRKHLKSLMECNVVIKREVLGTYNESFAFRSNDDHNSWKLH